MSYFVVFLLSFLLEDCVSNVTVDKCSTEFHFTEVRIEVDNNVLAVWAIGLFIGSVFLLDPVSVSFVSSEIRWNVQP